MMLLISTLTLKHEERGVLEALFEQYENAVFRLSFQILRNRSDAEDNTIQVFMNLSKVLHRIEPDLQSKRNKAFIYTITKYAALDLLRKRKLHLSKTRASETEPYISDIALEDFDYHALVHEMKSVSEADTELLILKYVIGLKSREIGRTAGLSTGAVELRLHRAKKQMRKSTAIRELREGQNHESL